VTVTAFGEPHIRLESTGSTNDVARELAEDGAASGTVVTADQQQAGRGRRGRVWAAPPGKALLFSAILRPLELHHSLLPLSVPVAVCEAVEWLAPVEARIKWPNDVWVDGAKVAGVLIEARPPEWAVIGIGLNVAIEPHEFPDDLRWPATSVGHGADVESARRAVCAALDRWVETPQDEALDAFRARDLLLGREIAWTGAGDADGEGIAAGVDDRGNLLVDLEGGDRLALGSGEISVRLG
jgi:BirA family biotin operon repressor/biotin-[acetyl-CoA-carboxylase] ligase